MLRSPLTLKQQSILYTVCNLEHYHHKIIRALPIKVRKQLFINLPVVDICSLEDLGVTDDMTETDNDYWEEVASQRIPRHHGYEVERNIMFDSHTDDWKAYYFAVTLHVLFDHIKPEDYRSHYELILHLLVGVTTPVDVYSWNNLCFSYFAPITGDRPLIPNRSLHYLTTRKSDMHFFSFVLDTCKYEPRFIYVICDLFRQSEIYKKHATSLLTKYFGKVEKIVFAFDYNEDSDAFNSLSGNKDIDLSYDIPALMLKAVLATENPALNSVEFRDMDGKMLGEILRRSGPLFYAAYSSLSNIDSKYIPYRRLQELVISLRGSKGVTSDVLQKLSTITQCQTKLKKVSLYRLVSSMQVNSERYLVFLSTLSPALKKSQFEKCLIKSMHIPVAGVMRLIESYLLSPAQSTQKLTFDNATIVGDVPGENSKKVPINDKSTTHKTLEFYGTDIPANFFKWLFTHSHLWLKRLAISNCKLPNSSHDYYNSKPEDILHLAAAHPSIRIANIDLGHLEFVHHRHSSSDFEKLLSNPYLEHLSICGGKLGHHGLIPDVIAGVKCQSAVKTLKSIALIGNQLGDIPDKEVQDLLDALFSLPQIEELEINLSHNDFAKYHYTMIYETWKAQCGGKQLKHFSCSGKAFPRNTPFATAFDEIAIKCYHW